MTATVVELAARYQGVQYDGTNGAAVAALFGASVVSDTGSHLEFSIPNLAQYGLDVGQWFVWSSDGSSISPIGLLDQALREALYAPLRPQVRNGTAASGTLLANAASTVNVQLSSAMPSDVYAADAVVLSGASLLGALEVTAVAVVDSDTVAVTVHNTGLVSLAGAIIVTAVG